jgi:ATPase subunit of ABC transporter with duplicated ATPase domains
MLAKINIAEKSMGGKLLYKDLNLSINDGQKIGLIGRNGTGKTTLLNLIASLDSDYDGQITFSEKTRLAFTRQEHSDVSGMDLIQYILEDLPEFKKLKKTLDSFSKLKLPSNKHLENYSHALERFNILGYFEVEEKIKEDLRRLQFSKELIEGKLSSLSGGQKRLAEVVKIMNSSANLVLMDEPTNHMDYVAKNWFINWLRSFQGAIVIVTHDRDVLAHVSSIIEVKDLSLDNFSGNYEAYLKQNAVSASSGAAEYENAQKRIEKLKVQIRQAVVRKLQAPPDQAKKWKILENRLRREHDELEQSLSKPSLWIDKESTEGMKKEELAKYAKYKAKNINVETSSSSHGTSNLIKVEDLSLGYEQNILFDSLNFTIASGEKVEIRGRNGAGKTTLVKAILDYARDHLNPSSIKYFGCLVETSPQISIGFYEQELSADYLSLTLDEAVEKFYMDAGIKINDQKIYSVISNYLFERHDASTLVRNLSGGQKARLQLIKMFVSEPNLLILDEPTNHLDLPSIEELEEALKTYEGAILYISHDTYFQKALNGQVINISN